MNANLLQNDLAKPSSKPIICDAHEKKTRKNNKVGDTKANPWQNDLAKPSSAKQTPGGPMKRLERNLWQHDLAKPFGKAIIWDT